MNWVGRVVCGLAIAGGFGASLSWARRSSSPEQMPVRSARLAPELDRSKQGSSSGSAEEVLRLRAELRRKDALLAALASERNATAEKPMTSPSPPEPDSPDPVARAIDILDERMMMAPADPRKAAEMERTLRDAVGSLSLGDGKVSSLYCSPALCKVVFAGPNEKAVNQSVNALSSHLPKKFGATSVLEVGNGQQAMYVAESNQELDPEPAGATKAQPANPG
jgi:hypothetical protein